MSFKFTKVIKIASTTIIESRTLLIFEDENYNGSYRYCIDHHIYQTVYQKKPSISETKHYIIPKHILHLKKVMFFLLIRVCSKTNIVVLIRLK